MANSKMCKHAEKTAGRPIAWMSDILRYSPIDVTSDLNYCMTATSVLDTSIG